MNKVCNKLFRIVLSFFSSLVFFIDFINSGLISTSFFSGIVTSILFIVFFYFSEYILKYRDDINNTAIKYIHIYSVIMAFLWLLSSSLYIDNTFNHIIDSPLNVFKAMIYLFGSYNILYLVSIFVVLWITNNIKTPQLEIFDCAFNYFKNNRLKLLLVIFVCWLPYMIFAYPAILDWDGWHSITIYLGIWGWTNFLHIFHTLFIGAFASIGEILGNASVGLYIGTLLQVFIYLFIINESFKLLYDLNTNSFILTLLLIIYSISPYYANFSSALIKDGIFSIFLVLFIIYLIRMIEWPDSFFYSKFNLLMFFIASMGVLAFRKNGMHIYVCIFAFILIYFLKTKKMIIYIKRIIFNFSVPIILICSLSLLVSHKTNALRGSINETLSLPYQQTARYLKYNPDDVTDEEKEIISKVLLYDQLAKVYDPMISDKVKSSVPDKPRNTKDMINYLIVWFKMFFKHPETYFAATFNQNYPLIYPFYGLKQTYFNYDPDYHPFLVYNDIYQTHKFELHTPFKEQRKLLDKYSKTIFDLPILALLCNISVFALLSIFLFIYAFINKLYKSILIFSSLILSIIIIILAPTIAKMPRYGLPIYYLFPIALCYLIYDIKFSSKKVKSKKRRIR